MRRLILFLLPIFLFAGYIHEHLAEKLETLNDNETIRVVIYLREQADCSNFPEGAYAEKIAYIKWLAETTQEPIVNWLMNQYQIPDLQQFSVVNAFACTLPKWLIIALTARDDVGFIIDDYEENLLLPNETSYILEGFNPGEDYIGWDVEIINAHQVWALGYEGCGVTVGNMDTGVDVDHPRLRNSYRGISAWYDAINGQATPYDDNGHGTGTMGLLIANYGIGTVPKAKWIAVKVMDSGGSATVAQVVDGFDWVFSLPDSLRPKVMSNSWGWSSGNDTLYWTCCLNWKNAGILPVFSAGNSGPGGNTIGRPARLPTTLAVAATDPYDRILSYSSRGPAPNVNPINNPAYWYRSDWNRHKPDIAAPADPTTTTAPGNAYQAFNGTSAASPHVAGVAGLLLSKDPELTPTNLYNIITDYAALVYPNSYNYPNDTFGWGRVDAFKTIQNTAAPSIPNVFITAASCTLDTDGDNELDPGETARIKLTIKNTGTTVTNLWAQLWENNLNITVNTANVNIGTLNPGQEITIWNHEVTAGGFLADEIYVYFKLEFYQSPGSYEKHDFFNIYVPMQAIMGGFTDTLIKDNGSAAYTLDESYWFAAQFVAAGPCSVTRVINMTYLGSSACSLGIWTDNGGQPGTRLYAEQYTAGASLAWQNEPLDSKVYVAPGNFWVGYWMSNNPTQEIEDSDGAAGGNMISSDGGNTWSDSYWYDFMIRPVVDYTSITDPALAYGSQKIDDSQFGNNDGWLDPGERVELSVGLKNYGVVCHNVTGILRPGDANTANWITFIDSTANFGTVHTGEGGNNVLDPFVIQMFDESSLSGWDPNFKLVLSGVYGANNSQNYTDSFNFTVIGPWMPGDDDTLWYPLGGDDLWIGYNGDNTWYWATHSLFATDSIYVDAIDVYVYSHNGTGSITLPLRIWNVGGNGYPGSEIWSANAPATVRGWASVNVGQKIPGEFYIGYRNVSPGANWNDIIIWGGYFIGDMTFVDADNNWAGGPDAGYIDAPLAFYIKVNSQTPVLSYYAPDGWTWPIIPSNSEQADTVLDATLFAADSTYLTDFVCLNRSDIMAGPVSGGFDNYLFLDNWSLYYTSPESLVGWYYTYTYTGKTYIPGGRHTLLSWLDWNDEIASNLFNNYLRIWGQQYVWAPELLPMRAPVTADYAPDYTGLGAGPYYNATAWQVDNWDNRWQGVGVRPIRFSSGSDSIDLDLRLYSDEPSDPNSGLTEVIEASCLGPSKVDFVVWNGPEIGTTYYPGIYSFGSANDSFYVNFYPSLYRIDTLFTQTLSFYMSSTTPIHVYDLILYANAPYNQYNPNLQPAAGLDLGIALFNSIGNDHILRRSDALISADANGPGGNEDFTYTNTSGVIDTFALVVWNNGGSGSYILNGKGIVIGVEEEKEEPDLMPTHFAFDAPYPNPFTKHAVINYAVPKSTRVTIQLYDVTGRLVELLIDKQMAPGYYQINIDNKDLASGIYFCRMVSDEFAEVKKLILTK